MVLVFIIRYTHIYYKFLCLALKKKKKPREQKMEPI